MVMKKNDLVAKCIQIRDSYKNRIPLNEEDKNWMMNEIFKYHPNWNDKRHKEIKEIIVNNNWSHYNTRCFYLVFDDDTYDDISFRWCIQHRPKSTL